MATVDAQVAHVWRRLGFGPTRPEVVAGVTRGPAALVDDLCSRPATDPATWGFPTGTDYTAHTEATDRLLLHMATSPNPLEERLAWVVSGLLVVGIDDLVNTRDAREHMLLCRRRALGSYKELLREATTSTAVLKYLTGHLNTRQAPNQNYARELMELFSLGIFHPFSGARNYSETDIVEIARALSGWRYDSDTNAPYFTASRWDAGAKTFLGADRGAAGVNEVIEAVSAQPAFRLFVPARMFREVVGLEPTRAELEALADVFGTTGDLRALVHAIARLPRFLSDEAIGSRVRSPVELVVAALRVLGVTDVSPYGFTWRLEDYLAQHPFRPPNVAGWPRGLAWLHAGHVMAWTDTLLSLLWRDDGTDSTPPERRNTVLRALWAAASPATIVDDCLRLACITEVPAAVRDALAAFAVAGRWDWGRCVGTLQLVMTSPYFMVN